MLHVERNQGISIVTLDRPDKRNALSIELRDRLADALDELSEDPDVRVVILTGRGDTFSAGFDLREFDTALTDPEVARRLWDSSDRFHRTVLDCPTPIVAAVNGPALAGGFDLAVMCDLRIASTSARFAHPEVAFGDVVYGPLHDLVGGSVARELALTGRQVDAAEALAMRLVSAVVEPDALMDHALVMAQAIAAVPRHLSRRTKAKIIRRAAIHPGRTLDL